jgi:hypothetical protein
VYIFAVIYNKEYTMRKIVAYKNDYLITNEEVTVYHPDTFEPIKKIVEKKTPIQIPVYEDDIPTNTKNYKYLLIK